MPVRAPLRAFGCWKGVSSIPAAEIYGESCVHNDTREVTLFTAATGSRRCLHPASLPSLSDVLDPRLTISRTASCFKTIGYVPYCISCLLLVLVAPYTEFRLNIATPAELAPRRFFTQPSKPHLLCIHILGAFAASFCAFAARNSQFFPARRESGINASTTLLKRPATDSQPLGCHTAYWTSSIRAIRHTSRRSTSPRSPIAAALSALRRTLSQLHARGQGIRYCSTC